MFELTYGLLGLAVFFGVMGSLILPWLHRSRLRQMNEQIERLSERLDYLSQRLPLPVTPSAAPNTAPSPAPSRWAVPVAPVATLTPVAASEIPDIGEAPELVSPAHAKQKPTRSFEQQFGARLPVWIGGIALALAGFYFVRYSIEIGLLSPLVRVLLGLLFGGGLIVAATKIGPHNARIGQALAGAGLAVLYVCIFAGTSLYDLFPSFLGFIGLIGVTALAIILALRHGLPIAVMGLIGGFVTPLLVGSTEPNTPLLLTYLYILFTALLWIIRRQHWWVLALLMAPFVLLWALLILVSAPASEAFFVALFLLALGATVVVGTRALSAAELAQQSFGISTSLIIRALTNLIIGIGAVMIGVATAKAGFGWLDRGLLFTLATGGIALAWFDHANYHKVPWLTLAVSLCSLAAWQQADGLEVRLTFALFAALHIGAGVFLLWRSAQPLFWSILGCSSAALFYLLAYARMGTDIDRITLWPYIEPKFWGGLALLLALAAISLAARMYKLSWASEALKQKLLAVFATTATGFIALGLTIELEKEFLTVALAAQVAALAYLRLKLNVTALRQLAGATALLFAILLLPQLVLLIQLSAYSLLEARLYLQDNLPMVRWPLFQLGVPAALLIAASIWLRRQSDGALVRSLEAGSIALIGIMGYYLMRHAFHSGDNVLFAQKAGFIERGTFTNILMLFGLACLFIAQRYGRTTVALAGTALILTGCFRLAWFDLFLNNPLLDGSQRVGATPLFNGLVLTYLVPVFWLWTAHKLQPASVHKNLTRILFGMMALLTFAGVNFIIRHLYQGDPLAGPPPNNAEMYTYSVAWLIMALALLIQGTRRHSKPLRLAALGLMLVTVGKVFLVDADELTGLWRVFSFLGLGLCLLGLSWFYTRFISPSARAQD